MDRNDDHYECVQPELGAELWRLDDAATAADVRTRLEGHLAVCDACRLARGIESRVRKGLNEGSLRLHERARAKVRRLAWSGALATAASLVLLTALPPRPLDDGVRTRAAGEPDFLKPVEGQVLLASRPELRWTPIEGASSYEVSLRAVGSSYTWQGTSAGASIVLPTEAALPRSTEIRARVRPVPHDLASTEGLGVMFRRGTLGDFVAHRLRHGARTAQAVGVFGLLALGLALTRRFVS